ncbi:hypothetical protein EYF80_014563 [Liparis tanakae]|uniref:Uncharacterized protein n=1 Tax=Liparis tanakae TaxID=230148 RepID=A0A4Z2IDN1_9TELE|nr:hypothetical protein EYF80_014563 [Liparis tanakae]
MDITRCYIVKAYIITLEGFSPSGEIINCEMERMELRKKRKMTGEEKVVFLWAGLIKEHCILSSQFKDNL